MEGLVLKKLRDFPGLAGQASEWFHGKWGVPAEAYLESMQAAAGRPDGVPQWYVLLDEGGAIRAGAGVIENDFHDRKDLAPNLCALFVDEGLRGRGVARGLLGTIREDMAGMGIPTLYLVTDHTEFYEKCGWEFLTMANEEDGAAIRLYRAETVLP